MPYRLTDGTVYDTERPGVELLTTEEVAARLGITYGGMRVMDHRGKAPPSFKVGRRRLYPADTFDEWLEAHIADAAERQTRKL